MHDFILTQQEVQANMRGVVSTLSQVVLASVRVACDEVVDEFLKLNNIVANHKMTFMERASLRSECRHLTRFLRLVDMMLQDSLKTLVLDTVVSLVHAVEQPQSDPFIEYNDEIELKTLAVNRKNEKRRSPLIRVEVAFKESVPDADNQSDKSTVVLKPSFDEIRHAIENALNDSLEVLRSLESVFDSPDAEMFIMPSGGEDADEDGGGEGSASDVVAAIKSNPFFVRDRDTVFRNLKRAFSAVKKYIQVFDPYQETYLGNMQYKADVSSIFECGDAGAFNNAICEYRGQIQMFADVPRFADVGLIFVDSSDIKKQMIPSPLECLSAIQDWLPQLIIQSAQAMLDEIGPMNPILGGDPSSVEAYVIKKKTKDKASTESEQYKGQQEYVNSLVGVMYDNEWGMNDASKAAVRMLGTTLNELERNTQLAESREEEEVKKFSQQTTEECPKLIKNINLCREALEKSMISDPESSDEKVLKFLQGQEVEFQRLKDRKDKLQEYQVTLKLPVDEFEVLEEVGADLNLKLRLWKDKAEWAALRNRMMATKISDMDVPFIERELQRYNKTVFMAGKGLPTNKVVPVLKNSVDEFNPVLPVVVDLRNDCLKDRHWEKINELLGFDIQAEESFTLQNLIDRGVTQHQEALTVIATAAQQEAILEEMMGKVTAIWDTECFIVNPYKDVKVSREAYFKKPILCIVNIFNCAVRIYMYWEIPLKLLPILMTPSSQ